MLALKIYTYFVLVLGTIFILALLSNISTYFRNKAIQLEILNTRELQYKSRLTLPERLDATTDLLTLCSTLIDSEVMKTIQGYALISSKYDIRRIDTDIELISTAVFNALNKESLLDKDLLLIPEHYLQYINNETLLRLLNVVREYNSSFNE